jgi:hypothetical protein
VAPSSTAISKSPVIPIESSLRPCPAASSRSLRYRGLALSGSP